jgi:hypothetical protein
MDWQQLENGLGAWVAAVCQLDTSVIAWESQPVGYRSFPTIDLRLAQSGNDRSTDEIRRSLNDAGQIVETVVGNRVATLTVTARSRDLHGNTRADVLLEALRTALAETATHNALDQLEVVVREAGPVQPRTESLDDREMSVAVLVIQLGYTVSKTSAEPIEPIEHVSFGGVVDPLGTIPDRTIP